MSVEFFGSMENPSAIVIRKKEKVEGIKFYSPIDFPQQIGLMSRSKNYKVEAHEHSPSQRIIEITQEVLIIRRGSCQITLFDRNRVESNVLILLEGDTILLSAGGHEIIMLEDCEILEVKQGPYLGTEDKIYFGKK